VGRAALTLAACLVLRAGVASGAVTLEQVVQKHLEWLRKNNNYHADILLKGSAEPLGSVFVDNTKAPREVHYQGNVQIGKRTRNMVISGTRNSSRAVIDGTRSAQWDLPAGPFGNSFDLFQRGVGVKETIDRIHAMSSEVEVLENPVGGRVGIKMQMAPGFLGQMDAFLDTVLLGGSIPRNIDSTLWFNSTTGRLERMVLEDGKPDMVIATLKYTETNVSAARARALVPKFDARARSYPSLVDLVKSVAAEDPGN
jgi:hypothetical protein